MTNRSTKKALPWLIGGAVALVVLVGGVVVWLLLRGGSIEIVSPADGATISVAEMADGVALTWDGGGDRSTALGMLCLTSPDEPAICPFELVASSNANSITWAIDAVSCTSCSRQPTKQTLVNLSNFLAEQAAGQEGMRWALHWKVVDGRTDDVPPIDDMDAVVDIVATPALSTPLGPEDLEILGGLG